MIERMKIGLGSVTEISCVSNVLQSVGNAQYNCGVINQLTTWRRVLFEKLIITQVVMKFSSCY